MHGRARVIVTDDAAAASARKAAALRRLTSAALSGRGALAAGSDTAGGGAEKLSAEVLAVNADVYSLWSARRQRMSSLCAVATACTADDAADTAAATTAVAAADAAAAVELRVSAAALARSPKSYAAWHHRAWTVATWPHAIDWAAELGLCAQLLAADERNFHCWAYRRWLVAAARAAGAGPSAPSSAGATAAAGGEPSDGDPAPPFGPAAELAFTLACIRRNFSNYSAWHGRSVLLREQAAAAAAAAVVAAAAATDHGEGSAAAPARASAAAAPRFGADEVPAALLSVTTLAAELALAQRALFTEPDDQSAWLYHRWLVDRLADAAEAAPGAAAAAGAALVDDVAGLCALRAAEPASKWPHLGLAHALQAAARAPTLQAALASAVAAAGAGGTQALALLAPPGGCGAAFAARAAYDSAAALDPARAACYAPLARALPRGAGQAGP